MIHVGGLKMLSFSVEKLSDKEFNGTAEDLIAKNKSNQSMEHKEL